MIWELLFGHLDGDGTILFFVDFSDYLLFDSWTCVQRKKNEPTKPYGHRES